MSRTRIALACFAATLVAPVASAAPPSASAVPSASPAAESALARLVPVQPAPNPSANPLYPTQVELDGTAGAASSRWWARADYLLWWMRSGPTPPLVAQDVPGTPRGAVGVPGTAGQTILFGGSGLNGDARSGLRLRGGYWLDDCHTLGLDMEYFFLSGGGDHGRFASTGAPILSRPFFNARTGLPDAELVAFPGVLAGQVRATSGTNFYGFAPALRCNLCCACDSRLDFLAGYRYLHLDDRLGVREDLTAIGPGAVPPGTRITVRDSFRATNDFHGGLVGLAGGWYFDNFVLTAHGTVAIGQTFHEVTINGSTVVTLPGGVPSVRAGGLLAQPSNIGRYRFESFAVAPEVGLDLGYQITPNVRVQVGYTFLYLSSVVRAGDQIDRGIDPVQLTGVPSPLGRPAFRPNRTDFWAQGINVGASFRF